MKKFILVFLSISISFYAQPIDLFKFMGKQKSSVSLGSSTAEVKKILGSPKSIDNGLIVSEDFIVSELPNIQGQLMYSTWYYPLPLVELKSDKYTKEHFFINGKTVAPIIYQEYEKDDSVYFYQGKIIFKNEAEVYKRNSDRKLFARAIYSKQNIDFKGKDKSFHFIPIIAVTFDKATQVVIAVNVFLKIFAD